MAKSMTEKSAQLMTAGLAGVVGALLECKSGSRIGAGSQKISTPFSNTTQADWAEAVQLWNREGRHLIGGLPARPCPACDASDSRHIFDSYDGYPYAECCRCGCWYVPLVVEASLFERYFESCPQAKALTGHSFSKRESEENSRADLARFNAYFDVLIPLFADLEKKSAMRYLDLGCGLGHSLLAARERGMVAVGIDSDRQCIAIGRGQGLDIRHASEPMPTEKFHLISFWESLEHMADPADALLRCASLLDEDGVLALSVPNQNSPLVRIQRADCSFVTGGFDTAGHINLFNAGGIETLLDRCGYTLLHIDGQYGLNLIEIVSYLVGLNRGASDLLRGTAVDSGLPAIATALLQSVGPAVSLLERVSLTSPILFAIACRKSSAQRFEKSVAELQARHKAALLEEVAALSAVQTARDQALIDCQNQLKHIHDHLQGEVNKRDELLHKTRLHNQAVHDHLQGEVTKRDQMLMEMQRVLDERKG
ncbi:hypothetical protein BH11PSE11_BH11PSE11_02570 [soil metagenome]